VDFTLFTPGTGPTPLYSIGNDDCITSKATNTSLHQSLSSEEDEYEDTSLFGFFDFNPRDFHSVDESESFRLLLFVFFLSFLLCFCLLLDLLEDFLLPSYLREECDDCEPPL
jgi:hypothetical protein